MNIIFLDIDGVLNNPGTFHRYMEKERPRLEKEIAVREKRGEPIHDLLDDNLLEKKLVLALDAIIRKHDIHVVFSSSWRLTMTIRTVNKILSEAAKKNIKWKWIGKTPSGGSREKEILTFIRDKRLYGNNLIVLDDIPMKRELKDYSIFVDGATGLIKKDIIRIDNICHHKTNIFNGV